MYESLLARLSREILDPKLSLIRKSHLQTKIRLLKQLVFRK